MKLAINSVGTQDCIFPRFCSRMLRFSHSSAHRLQAKCPKSNVTGKVQFYVVTEAKIQLSLLSAGLSPLLSSQPVHSFTGSQSYALRKTLFLTYLFPPPTFRTQEKLIRFFSLFFIFLFHLPVCNFYFNLLTKIDRNESIHSFQQGQVVTWHANVNACIKHA